MHSSVGTLVPANWRDHPAVGELVVEDDRVTRAARLADAAEPRPERRDPLRPEQRRAGRLVEDLEAGVDELDVLGRAHLAVRIGRPAVAVEPRERDPVEVEAGRRHRARESSALHDGVRLVRVIRLRPRVRARLHLAREPQRRRLDPAQSRRDVAPVRVPDDHPRLRGRRAGGPLDGRERHGLARARRGTACQDDARLDQARERKRAQNDRRGRASSKEIAGCGPLPAMTLPHASDATSLV